MSDNPTPDESQVKLFGYEMSTRGLIAFIVAAGLTGLTFKNPETFAKAYESVAIAVIGFYFGQATKK